jgi:hypothetical protein
VTRRRKRLNLKAINSHVRMETYIYVSEVAGADGSMGIALDRIAREHAWLTQKKDITPEKRESKVQ